MAHEDIKYEQACILYNLGELPNPFPMGLPLSSANPGSPLSRSPLRQWAHGQKTPGFRPLHRLPHSSPRPLSWAMGTLLGEKLLFCHVVVLLCALARSSDLSVTGQL